jgi:hypothetical protein
MKSPRPRASMSASRQGIGCASRMTIL